MWRVMVKIESRVETFVDVDVEHSEIVKAYETADLVSKFQLLNAILLNVDDVELAKVVQFVGQSTEFIEKMEDVVKRWRSMQAT